MTQDTPSSLLISDESYDAIIFDLGGVVLPLYPERTVARFSELFEKDASPAYTQTAQNELFDAFERGELTAAQFREGVCKVFKRSVPASAFDDAWNAMLGSLPAAHLDLLASLGQKKRVFLLSNTNEVHLTRFLADFARDHPTAPRSFADYFEAAHYSHELGMRKPEARIFETLLERHHLTAQRTVFIDDNEKNVSAACSVGLLGVHHQTNAPLLERF
jgi:putative hydrolase of the HAD superfamily